VRVSTKRPMLTPHDIHHGIILPAFLAAAILFIALIPKLRSRAPIILLISLTTAFVFPYMHLFDRPPLPPVESTSWLFYLPIAVFPIALILDFVNFRLLALPLFFLSPTLILWPILRNDHSFAESATIITLIASASFLSYLSLTQLSPRIGGRSIHLILLLLLAASAQILFMSGSQTLGQTALILTAALAGALPLAFYLKIPLTPGPTLLILLLSHGFLIAGLFTANLTPLNAILLAIAPHLAWLAEFRARNWPKFGQMSLRFAAVLIPMLVAQILAWRDFREAMKDFNM
jgi:hypothetical protein